jgi:hypothetical protein
VIDQPPLDFAIESHVELEPPKPVLVERLSGTGRRGSGPPRALPDAELWAASLAQAMAETLQGRRPIGQLARWVDDQVLATMTVALRRRTHRPTVPGRGEFRPTMLRSVRVQFPRPQSVEASAHLQVGSRSIAIAFRLEAWYDRWLCTALDLGHRGLGW